MVILCSLTNTWSGGKPQQALSRLRSTNAATRKLKFPLSRILASSDHNLLDFTLLEIPRARLTDKFLRRGSYALEEVKSPSEESCILSTVAIWQHAGGGLATVAFGRVIHVELPYLVYAVTTDFGSSGSMVLLNNKLVGLHHQRIRDAVMFHGQSTQANKAGLIEDIADWLDHRGQTMEHEPHDITLSGGLTFSRKNTVTEHMESTGGAFHRCNKELLTKPNGTSHGWMWIAALAILLLFTILTCTAS